MDKLLPTSLVAVHLHVGTENLVRPEAKASICGVRGSRSAICYQDYLVKVEHCIIHRLATANYCIGQV